MSDNRLTYVLLVVVGAIIGDWLATLFGVGFFSFWAILSGVVFALLFYYLATKIFR